MEPFPSAPVALAPPRSELAARLWNGAERALLLGDLYLATTPALYDRAIDLGTELAELAERVDVVPCPELLAVAETALERAERTLAPLAPQG